MSDPELKPCPFCGGEPVYTVLNNSAYICCKLCRATSGFVPYTLEQDVSDPAWKARVRQIVSDKWNRRAI